MNVSCEVSGIRMRVPDGHGGQRIILDVLHMKISQGTIVAIAGASGSGKTTLLHCLTGINRPSVGRIRMQDVQLDALSEFESDAWRRTHVGLMFQDFQLVPEMTALQNVLLPTHFARSTIAPKRATELLARHGIGQYQIPVSRMSRGEQQRIAFARALLFSPPFIIADEPTASLDRDNASGVITELQHCAASGKSVIVATHDADILAVAHRVIMLDHGCLRRQQDGKAA